MVSFWKMNGAGNDFVVLDNRDNALSLSGEQIARLCQRQRCTYCSACRLLLSLGLKRQRPHC